MKLRTSYLRGFSENDFYQAVGAFRGSLPSGFFASVLMRPRDVNPLDAAENPWATLIGNYQEANAGAESRGWQLHCFRALGNLFGLEFDYGDGALVLQSINGFLFPSPVCGAKSMLVDIFFGADIDGQGPQALIYVNGNLFLPAGAINLATGYTPAPANNPFRVGRGVITTVETWGRGMEVGGIAYYEGLPEEPSLLDINDIANAHWNSVQLAEDQTATDVPQITDLYSVRRELHTVEDGGSEVWAPSIGNINLQRVGSASLATGATKPRWLDHPWAV